MPELLLRDDRVVWVDLEMTGLDPSRHVIVEVAALVTDANLNILDSGIDLVVHATEAQLSQMDDFVRNMHTESGLIDEFETGVSLEEAQREVLDYVKKFVPQSGQALLAGNSIGTDKAFLERDMPELINYLHYRVVDVSSIKELAKRWYHRTFEEAPAKHGGHRALADILESIQELVYYRRVLFPQGEGPSRQEARQVAAEVVALGIPNIE